MSELHTKELKAPDSVGYGMVTEEALFALFGWLTTRSDPLTLGAAEDASPAVAVIEEYIRTFPERIIKAQ